MLYPLTQALFYVFIIGVILAITGYTLRTEIAHLIGKTRKQINTDRKEIIQEYHRGMEEGEE